MATSGRHPVATVRLPFEFDTRSEVKFILQGVLALLFVVVLPGVLYSLFISRNRTAVFALLVVGAIAMSFGAVLLKNLRGSAGTISADAVVVEAGRLYGIPLAGPAGRFPMDRFKAVRVARIQPSIEGYSRGHDRVLLAGRENTPDIIVARTELGAGKDMGQQLAAALELPFEEQAAPY